jgi:plastocyanin
MKHACGVVVVAFFALGFYSREAHAAAPAGQCQCNLSVIAGATGMTMTSGAARGPCGREMAPGKVGAVRATARSMASRELNASGSVAAAAAAAASSVSVQVHFSDYNPDPTINVGDTVVWSFNDFGLGHTVISVAGSAEVFDSGSRTSGTFQHTFTHAGTFNYYCIFHGFDNGDGTADGMAGTITVVAAPEPGVAAGVLAFAGIWCGRRRKR